MEEEYNYIELLKSAKEQWNKIPEQYRLAVAIHAVAVELNTVVKFKERNEEYLCPGLVKELDRLAHNSAYLLDRYLYEANNERTNS